MKKLSSLVTLIALALTACEDYIEKPFSTITPSIDQIKSVQELDQILTGAYASIASQAVLTGTTQFIGDAMGDLLTLNNVGVRNGGGSNEYRIYNWSHREVDGILNGLLTQTAYANNNATTVLDVLRAGQVKTEGEGNVLKNIAQQQDRIEGEARFLRAMAAFEQLKLIAYPWGFTPDNGHPGHMLSYRILSGVEGLSFPRPTVRVAYDSLVRDLHLAERKLPEFYDPARHPADYQVRANKYAALALLAKVYWQQDNMDSCRAVCDRLLGEGTSYRFPLTPGGSLLAAVYQRSGIVPTLNSANRSEVIFETVNVVGRNVQTTNGTLLQSQYRLATPYATTALNSTTALGSGPIFRLGQRFKELADFDRRRDIRYRTLIDTTQAPTAATAWNSPNRLWFTRKWGAQGTANLGTAQGVNINIPVFRSAEFILMRAEALVRTNNTAAALADLNAVRVRAGLPELTTVPANLLDEIRKEYIRETFTEGTRTHDLRRRKAPTLPSERTLSPLQQDCAGNNCAEVPWNSRALVFQIPRAFLDRNPQAVRND